MAASKKTASAARPSNKKVAAKKPVAKKPATERTSRPHHWVFDGASKITFKGDNPAREGSRPFQLYELLKKGGTVEQYRERAEKAGYPVNVAQWAMRLALQKGIAAVGGKTENKGK